MSILTFSRVKILFGMGLVCLLVQCLYFVNYYNLITTIQRYVPSTKPEPKPHEKFSDIQTMGNKQQTDVDNKNQTNILKNKHVNLVNFSLCPEILPALNEKVNLLVPDRMDLEDVALQLSRLRILKGGHQMPLDCEARYKIAILVPYRNRMDNLCSFLLNLHPFLTKQKLDYTIFVIEQFNDGKFNRGKLLNIGYTEALKLNNFDCFFLHDVDLIPMNNNNMYSCPIQPRHMATANNKYGGRMPYSDYFGGVVGINRTHFELVNGFSNMYWGWGGEDDDFLYRISYHNLKFTRLPGHMGRYYALSHSGQLPNPERIDLLHSSFYRFDTDGLNTLNYKIKSLEILPLFTHFLVDLDE
ncbi:beta-1,4-galactosyltransferase 4-like [Rhopalosiphum padi]|uniref:beta-1,4-galactosyltransferase 4-like n=1 Tax=Rhopalosiphum padi TaxID=40932 RepID=UPI00298EA3D9|nr:beta-1,4-galactosyltransferase 4-like [Rhopalosiphum padi]